MNTIVKAKITPPNVTSEREYPYWATNATGDLFYVGYRSKAIAIGYRAKMATIDERMLTPVPLGSKIELIA